MNEPSIVILRDQEGIFYLLTPELLEQARASAEEQGELARAVEEQDTAGHSAGVGAPFTLVGMTTAVQSPRDVATGQATGRRQFTPFHFVKVIDKSSPS